MVPSANNPIRYDLVDSVSTSIDTAKPEKKLLTRRNFLLVLGGSALAIGVPKMLGNSTEGIEGALEPRPVGEFTPPAPSTTRVTVSNPEAPPATNVERPTTTSTEQLGPTPEEIELKTLSLEFSELVNAKDLSPYALSLNLEKIPDPVDNIGPLLEADAHSMSLLLTHSYGRKEWFDALFKTEGDNAFENTDILIEQSKIYGRYRFPPEDDPDYDLDHPNYGVLVRFLYNDPSVFFYDNNSKIIILGFQEEKLFFDYNLESSSWEIISRKIVTNRASRGYEKQTVSLTDENGRIHKTAIWKITNS